MTELLAPGPEDMVLEIGTGSGYQTAVLASLAQQFTRWSGFLNWRTLRRGACGNWGSLMRRFALAMAAWAGKSKHPLMGSW